MSFTCHIQRDRYAERVMFSPTLDVLSYTRSMANRRPMVVVATASFGAGHVAAGVAVCRVLSTAWPGVDVRRVDAASSLLDGVSMAMRQTYFITSTVWRGWPYRVLYWLFDTFPLALSKLSNVLLGRSVRSALLRYGMPDFVIATYPTVAYMARRRLPSHVPVVSCVTDAAGVNRIWFQGGVDRFLVVDAESVAVARSCGVTPERTFITGLPMVTDGTFPSREAARRKLGIPDVFVVLFTAGGAGLGNGVLRTARVVADTSVPVFGLLNAGANKRLAREFTKLTFERGSSVTEFDEDFPVQLAACDIVVGKAGMMTLTEALAARKPTLIVDAIPGQEERNRVFAVRQGAALAVSPRQAAELVAKYAGDQTTLSAAFDLEHAAVRHALWRDRLVGAVVHLLDRAISADDEA